MIGKGLDLLECPVSAFDPVLAADRWVEVDIAVAADHLCPQLLLLLPLVEELLRSVLAQDTRQLERSGDLPLLAPQRRARKRPRGRLVAIPAGALVGVGPPLPRLGLGRLTTPRGLAFLP